MRVLYKIFLNRREHFFRIGLLRLLLMIVPMVFLSFPLYAEEDTPVPLQILPGDNYGVDWVKSVEQGMISPISSLDGKPVKKYKLPEPFIIKSKKKVMTDVLFSHDVHAYWLNCNACHPSIFPKKIGGTKDLSMKAIFKGKFCGKCHDVVAFRMKACYRCHLPFNKDKRKAALVAGKSKRKMYKNFALGEVKEAKNIRLGLTGKKAVEKIAAAKKVAAKKAAQKKAEEKRLAAKRAAEKKTAEERLAAKRASEKKVVEEKVAEEKATGNEIDLLRKALSERTRKQIEDCTMELNRAINEVLNKYQCVLDVSMVIRQGSVTPNIGVLPRVNK